MNSVKTYSRGKSLPEKAVHAYVFMIFVSLVLLVFNTGFLSAQNVDSIRQEYFSMDEKDCAWENITDKINNPESPLLMAYEGASLAASAECQQGAMKKLKRFKEGKEKLEKAVDLMPESTEIRFLRYTVKVKSPGILNYNDKEADEEFILQKLSSGYKTMDGFLLQEICSFLLEHGNLNADAETMVRNIYQI